MIVTVGGCVVDVLPAVVPDDSGVEVGKHEGLCR